MDRSRSVTDSLLAAIASPRRSGIPSFLRPLLVAGLAGLTVLSWPLLSVRRRSMRSGHRVSPWRFGTSLGRSFCDLLGRPRVVEVQGSLPELSQRGLLLLAAHLGPWEAGAAELARRGLRPGVLAAPWPRLPRTARAVAMLRRNAGVLTFQRGHAGWKAATRHLRSGGTVVALVDSLGSGRRGRRPLPFVEGPVGAPDALIAWAQRQGAALAVAVGNPSGFVVRELEAAPVAELSDRCVALLRSGIGRHPSSWAWVRALAMIALGLPMASFGSWGCAASESFPPIPRDPEQWLVEVEGLEWSGSLPGRVRGRFRGARAQGKWVDQAPAGRFETILVELWSEDTGIFLARIEAERGVGTWPEGPLNFEQVDWQLQSVDESGHLETASWSAPEGWRCGGCALEALQP